MVKLTGALLKEMAPKLKQVEASEWADAFNKVCPLYGIDTPDIFHEFIANVLHESGQLTILSENLNYTTEALISKFGRHRISIVDAEAYGRKPHKRANQEKIANLLYGGEWGRQNLGNRADGDGWLFRGAGPIQITGRRNFSLFWIYMNKFHGYEGTLSKLSEQIKTDKVIAVHSACWVFAIAKNLIHEAINDNMKLITKRINGGYFGMNDRIKYYNKAKEIIV